MASFMQTGLPLIREFNVRGTRLNGLASGFAAGLLVQISALTASRPVGETGNKSRFPRTRGSGARGEVIDDAVEYTHRGSSAGARLPGTTTTSTTTTTHTHTHTVIKGREGGRGEGCRLGAWREAAAAAVAAVAARRHELQAAREWGLPAACVLQEGCVAHSDCSSSSSSKGKHVSPLTCAAAAEGEQRSSRPLHARRWSAWHRWRAQIGQAGRPVGTKRGASLLVISGTQQWGAGLCIKNGARDLPHPRLAQDVGLVTGVGLPRAPVMVLRGACCYCTGNGNG